MINAPITVLENRVIAKRQERDLAKELVLEAVEFERYGEIPELGKTLAIKQQELKLLRQELEESRKK